MRFIVLVLLVVLLYELNFSFANTNRTCAFKDEVSKSIPYKTQFAISPTDDNSFSFSFTTRVDDKFTNCTKCYSLWNETDISDGDRHSGWITILSQGCWKSTDSQNCHSTGCIVSPHSSKAVNRMTKFCCCTGDECNTNITSFYNQIKNESISSKHLDHSDSKQWVSIVVISLTCSVSVICIIGLIIYRKYPNIMSKFGKRLSYTDQLMDSTVLKTGTYMVDHLKLTAIVGQGRYGSVWQGCMGDQEVAVKIFPSHYRNYFQNERDMYCLPFMDHPSLLEYYGVDERVSLEGNIEYLLVFSFAPGGTLTDFLQNTTIDWATFCRMGLSIVKGLAYLHTDIHKGDKFKPCLAHRDLNSRNILIKADNTCCICDLGLAVQISGSKYYSNGEEQHAEIKSLNDVGTLRYMAPEILEGAVNLRDCESSLKQIDVYALGLVIWELVSRCTDIYIPGTEIPAYKLPYESEIGVHPTFEQMQVLVSRNKARPLLKGNLVDKSGIRLIKETMEDCWDADAEARLTALCVEERLSELQSHRVMMHFTDGSPMVNSHSALVPSTTNSLYSENCNHDNVHVVQLTSQQQLDSTNEVGNVDNLITLSPSDSIIHEHSFKNSNEVAMYKNVQTLQPHQGRNPCMERNLMSQSDSLEGCNGNILIDKSCKHLISNDQQYKLSSETRDYMNQQHPAQLLHLRPATPIPYVQNAISEDTSITSVSKDKQTNIEESHLQDSPRRKTFTGWPNLKKLFVKKRMMYAYGKHSIDREDSKSNLLLKQNVQTRQPVETNVTISSEGKYVNGVVDTYEKDDQRNSGINIRPSILPLDNIRRKKQDTSLSRQESIDKFNEVFNVGSSLSTLKDPHMRIKTPGDLPPSVRKVRGRVQSSARFSLYDDRMMCNILNEEEDNNDKTVWNSVPFGMDRGDNDDKTSITIGPKNVTCF